jgi:hypothetical protein
MPRLPHLSLPSLQNRRHNLVQAASVGDLGHIEDVLSRHSIDVGISFIS